MTDQATLQSNGSGPSQTRRAKGAAGAFPRIALSKVMDLPRMIYQLGEGDLVRRLTVFDRLGRAPESGTSRTLITAASSGYGLTVGGYQAEFLGLTERGRAMVSSANDSTVLRHALDALFANPLFAAFVIKFNQRGFPAEEIAVDFFRKEHKLSEADAKACWAVVRDNLMDYGLTQELSGRRIVISKAMALERIDGDAESREPVAIESSPPSVSSSAVMGAPSAEQKGTRSEPQIHFNIQVHLPDSAAPEVYESIFKNIATYLLGRDGD